MKTCMYSKIFSVTDASAYFKHLISSKHNRPTSFSINLPTTPYPRRKSDIKKKAHSATNSLCSRSEYGVQSSLTFPYLQQP